MPVATASAPKTKQSLKTASAVSAQSQPSRTRQAAPAAIRSAESLPVVPRVAAFRSPHGFAGKDVSDIDPDLGQVADMIQGSSDADGGGAAATASAGYTLLKLVGNQNAQFISWCKSIFNPFAALIGPDEKRFMNLMPSAEYNARVPLDPYVRGWELAGQTNAIGFSCALYEPDTWVNTGSAPSGPDNWTFLQPNSVGCGIPCYTTGREWGLSIPSDSTPAFGAAPSTATTLNGPAMPNVSADITSETEFVFNAGGIRFRSQLPGNVGSTQSDYYGSVYRCCTVDPIRYPLTGMTYEQLRTLSLQSGSSYTMDEFKIARDGTFISELGHRSTYIDAICVPLTRTAYRLNSIAGRQVNVGNPTVAFIVKAIPNYTYLVLAINQYGITRFPTGRFLKPSPTQVPVWDGFHKMIASALQNAMLAGNKAPTGSGGNSVLAPIAAAASSGQNMNPVLGFLKGLGEGIIDKVMPGPAGVASVLTNVANHFSPGLSDKLASWASGHLSDLFGVGQAASRPLALGPGAVPSGWTIGSPVSQGIASGVEVLEEESIPMLEAASGELPILVGELLPEVAALRRRSRKARTRKPSESAPVIEVVASRRRMPRRR